MGEASWLPVVAIAGALGVSGYLLWRWLASMLRGSRGCAGCPSAAQCAGCPATREVPGGRSETTLVVGDLTEENADRLMATLLSMEGVVAGQVIPGGRLRVTYQGDKTSPQAMIAALEAAVRASGDV